MIGATAEVLEDFETQGPVFVHGERWNARSAEPLKRGDRVRITAIDGLELHVATSGRQG